LLLSARLVKHCYALLASFAVRSPVIERPQLQLSEWPAHVGYLGFERQRIISLAIMTISARVNPH